MLERVNSRCWGKLTVPLVLPCVHCSSHKIPYIWQLIVLGPTENSMCLSGGRFDMHFQYCPSIVRIWTCGWKKMLVHCIFHVILLSLRGCNIPQPWENTLFLRSVFELHWLSLGGKYYSEIVCEVCSERIWSVFWARLLWLACVSFLYQLKNSGNHHLSCVPINRNLTGRI